MVPLFSTPQGKWKGSDQKSEEDDKWRVKMEKQSKTEEDESPPSINLDLGIGGPSTSRSDYHHRLKNNPCNTARDVKVEPDDNGDAQVIVVEERERGKKQRNRKCSVACFTEQQLEEFKAQLVIFKYMVSGLPVPIQLLLPIWRCFPSSVSPLYCDLRRRKPFFLGLSNCGFNNPYLMDPEPGRCRRTDGKKWRCHHAVVPNQKYCERHMHRGSKRSRKLVEGSTQASMNPGALNLVNTNPKNAPSNEHRIKFLENLNQKPLPPTHQNPMSSHSSVGGSIGAKNCPTRVMIRVPCLTSAAKFNENNEQKNAGKHNSIMKDRIAGISLSSGLDFSPKSVLQGGQKCAQITNPKNDPNAEAGRCRRTDGKKWRCYKSVLPDQKYCACHINRGTKRPVALSASGDAASDVKFFGPEEAEMGKHPNNGLNAPLTVSLGDPRHSTPQDSVTHNGENSSISETTISDDSADILDKIVLSP